MIELLVGPVLRRVAGSRATIFVETSRPARVEIRTDPAGRAGGSATTFTAFDHHYALVLVDGLPAGTATPYQVYCDDVQVWPQPEARFPPSVIRTRPAADPAVRVVFGSCREATQRTSERGFPPDALDAYARRLAAEITASTDPDLADVSWPDTLMLLGDQVYADETSADTRDWLRDRRAAAGVPADSELMPADQVVSFDEYTRLYHESWRDPEIRWLLSTVPSVMIFDDHEIIDDWNTSAAWYQRQRRQPWWQQRIASGIASYWIYQHLGNLDPDALDDDPVLAKVRGSADATELLRQFGADTDQDVQPVEGSDYRRAAAYRWSYAFDLGRTRIVVLDNRCGRVLHPEHRDMLTEEQWRWVADVTAPGAYDHLVIGSSLPWLLPPGVHHLEAWNAHNARWGSPRRVRRAERLRQAVDMEHWAAFRESFDRLAGLLTAIGSAAEAPVTVSVLSGDVHHSYVARAELGSRVTSAVHQLTCSPLHNQIPRVMRPALAWGWRAGPSALVRRLAAAAGVAPLTMGWRRLAGPYFGNAVGTLTQQVGTAEVTIEGTDRDGQLQQVARVRLAESAWSADQSPVR